MLYVVCGYSKDDLVAKGDTVKTLGQSKDDERVSEVSLETRGHSSRLPRNGKRGSRHDFAREAF